MPNFTTNINLNYEEKRISKSWTKSYEEAFVTSKVVDSTDAGVFLIEFDQAGFLAGKLKEAKTLVVCNDGNAVAEIVLGLANSTGGTPDAGGGSSNSINTLLFPGESIVLPTGRMLRYSSIAASATLGDGGALDNTLLSSLNSGDLYLDSTVNVDSGDLNNTTNPVTFGCGNGNFFEVDDWIRVGSEIMQITKIATIDLTVNRGLAGSTIATHSGTPDILFPFFNAHHDYSANLIGSSALGCTDSKGRWKSYNFFGKARTGGAATAGISGLVPGSVAFIFFTSAYHEINFKNPITTNTSSGLSSDTAYSFDITVADSATDTIVFTTGSNVNFGGANGVVSKINSALKTAYETNGGFLEGYVVSCAIVNGRLRFTDHSNLHPHDGTNGSKVLIEDSSDTGTGADLLTGSVGIFPNDTALVGPVAARLPLDVKTSPTTGITTSNDAAFMRDDGYGNLIYPANAQGNVVGTVNYITGALDFTLPGKPFAEFGINAHYDSAFSGRIISGSATAANHIYVITGRSVNSKINTKISVYSFR